MRENQTYQGPDKDIASPSLNTTKILGFQVMDVRPLMPIPENPIAVPVLFVYPRMT